MTESEKIICKMYLDDLDKHHRCNEYKLIMQLIDNARAVGKWKYNEAINRYQCSVCNISNGLTKEDVEEGFKLSNYCPECGADLRDLEDAKC